MYKLNKKYYCLKQPKNNFNLIIKNQGLKFIMSKIKIFATKYNFFGAKLKVAFLSK